MKSWTDPKPSFSDNGKKLLLIVGQGAHKSWMVRILAEVICTTLRPDIRVPTDLHMTNQQKYMFLFHLIFLLRTTIWPEFRVSTDLFLLCVNDHSQKYMFLFHLFFLLCTTIRRKTRFLIDLHLLFAHDHSTRIYGPLSFNLFFVHDHSTKN